MVSGCLPSDALSQHLPSYLGFSYLGHGVYLHGCSSKAQPLLLTLEETYLLTATPPDLERGVALLSALLRPHSRHSLDVGLLLSATAPDLGRGVAPLGHHPWPQTRGSSSSHTSARSIAASDTDVRRGQKECPRASHQQYTILLSAGC